MNIILHKLFNLGVNENSFLVALWILFVFQIKANFGELLISLLESILLQKGQELMLLRHIFFTNDLVKETFIKWIDVGEQRIDVLLESVELINTID